MISAALVRMLCTSVRPPTTQRWSLLGARHPSGTGPSSHREQGLHSGGIRVPSCAGCLALGGTLTPTAAGMCLYRAVFWGRSGLGKEESSQSSLG